MSNFIKIIKSIIKKILLIIFIFSITSTFAYSGNTGLGTSPFVDKGKFKHSDANAINDAANGNAADIQTLQGYWAVIHAINGIVKCDGAGTCTAVSSESGLESSLGSINIIVSTEIDSEAELESLIGVEIAHSGNNSDITQILGLTTPLSRAQGGTGIAAWFDLTPSSEGWQGPSAADAIAGEALSVGDIVYRKNVSGATHYFKYSANSTFTDNATYRPCGIATTAAAGAASTFTLGFGHGVFRMDSYSFVDADRGKTVYASETAGSITITAPSDVDDLVYPLGSIISPDVVEFDFNAGNGSLVRVKA